MIRGLASDEGMALGVIGVVSLVLLTIHKNDPSISIIGEGALERGGLYAILLWQILAAVTLVRSRTGRGAIAQE
jgi:hypothetical protein